MKSLRFKNDESRIRFANDFFNLYLEKNFGTLNKTEFEELLLELLRRHSNIRDMSNFEISINLHIPESRVRSLFYRSQLKYVKYSIADIRTQFFSQLWQGYFEIKGDLIHITIENQYVKQAIESIVKEKGKNPIGTFNKETLILTTDGFADLLPALFIKEEIDQITKEIKKKKDQSFYKAIKSLINPDAIKESISELCGAFVEGVGEAVGTAIIATNFAALLD